MNKKMTIVVITLLTICIIGIGSAFYLNNAEKTEQIETLTADAADKAEQIEVLTADAADKAEQIEALTADAAEKTEQIETLTADATDKAKQIEALTAKSDELSARYDELNETKTAEISRIEYDLASARDELKAKEEELSEAEDKLKAAEIRITSAEEEIEGMTSALVRTVAEALRMGDTDRESQKALLFSAIETVIEAKSHDSKDKALEWSKLGYDAYQKGDYLLTEDYYRRALGEANASDGLNAAQVQVLLYDIGLLSRNDLNGSYDSGTTASIRTFQEWVNRQRGEETLPVNGKADALTVAYMQYCVDHEIRVASSDASAPGSETEPAEDSVSKPQILISGQSAVDSRVSVTEDSFRISWSAEGDVQGYQVQITDADDNVIISQAGISQTGMDVDAGQMQPGMVYTIIVGAVPEGGCAEDVAWSSGQFVKPAPGITEPTSDPTAMVVVPFGESYDFSTQINPDGTARYFDGDDNFDTLTFTLTMKKSMLPSDYASKWGRLYRLQGDEAGAGFELTLHDYTGTAAIVPQNILRFALQSKSGNTVNTGFQLMDAEVAGQNDVSVRPNEPRMFWKRYSYSDTGEPMEYLAVGTYNDGLIQTILFALKPDVVLPSLSVEDPTPEPTAAAVGAPEITVSGSGYQSDGMQYMTDDNMVISWGADGDVDSYIVYVMNQAGECQDLGTTTDTDRTVAAGSLPAGIYTVYVGAIPMYGDREDAQWSAACFGIPKTAN